MRCWKNHHDMIVNATLAFLMGFFMGVSILLIEHTPVNWVSLVTIWAKITFVVTVILMILPVGSWGEKFAVSCKCKKGSIPYTLVENLVPTFIINTVLAAVVPALGIFYNDAIPADQRMSQWKAAFFGGWLLTFIISYFFGLFSAKLGGKIADSIAGEK